MKCPFCKQDDDRVIDSRSAAEGTTIRRRRECRKCGRRYTTYERIEQTPIRVIKKDGRRVDFDRNKILAGLRKACEKRPIPTATLDRIVTEIETEIYDNYEKEVPSKVIGQMVMEKLKSLDKVAYVRFASVYREFKDVSDFEAEIKQVKEPEKNE